MRNVHALLHLCVGFPLLLCTGIRPPSVRSIDEAHVFLLLTSKGGKELYPFRKKSILQKNLQLTALLLKSVTMSSDKATQELYTCIDNFINHDTLSSLMHTMQHLQNAFMECSDLDGSDAKVVTDVINDTARINMFFIELSEKFKSIGHR